MMYSQPSRRYHREDTRPRSAPESPLVTQRSTGSTRSIGSNRSNRSNGSGRSKGSTNSQSAMPIILLIPGAWLPPACYSTFVKALNEAGYITHVRTYPSLNPAEPSTASCAADADYIRRYLELLVEREEKDVVLIMHSYAGMPGAAAARGFAKPQRLERGRSGGVLGLVFVAAFLVPEGMSCAGSMGGSLPPWISENVVSLFHSLAPPPLNTFSTARPWIEYAKRSSWHVLRY